jgi:hypothetical protein
MEAATDPHAVVEPLQGQRLLQCFGNPDTTGEFASPKTRFEGVVYRRPCTTTGNGA